MRQPRPTPLPRLPTRKPRQLRPPRPPPNPPPGRPLTGALRPLDRGGGAVYGDPNVNLLKVAEYDPGGGALYYYAQVQGQAMAGQGVPATKRALPSPTRPSMGPRTPKSGPP